MPNALLPRLGVAALFAAAPALADNPLLPPWTGPYGGVPPFDQVKVEHFEPALEAGMAEQLAEIDAIADEPGAADLREHDRRAGARRPDARPRRRRSTASASSTLSDARVPGGRAGDGAEARRVRRQDHPERGAVRAHRGGLRRARPGRARPPEQQRLVWLDLQRLRARRRQARRRGQAAARRDQPAARRAVHAVRPERARRRDRLRALPRRRSRPRRPAGVVARGARRRPPTTRGHEGKWADHQHPLHRWSRS